MASTRSMQHNPTHNYSNPVSLAGASHGASLATRLNNVENRAGAVPSLSKPRSYQRNTPKTGLRSVDTAMTSYTSTITPPTGPRSVSSHSKLHKRGGSGGSFVPAPPSPHSQFTTPFATYEEPFPNLASTTRTTPKIKPFRKTSATKEDGKIDLSKSMAENERLAGLGIQDFGARSVSNVAFPHTNRRGTHGRTTSVGSQASTGSSSYKPTQFVHPMRQTPRPYTPPMGSANASFVQEDYADESDDVIDDDFRLGHGHRSKRSMSITSMPATALTPLSQSHTADDLGIVPKLTSPSQTNLSIRSGVSSKSRPGKPRRDTDRSFELPTSPSSRTSFDRAFSLVSRKSDQDAQTREDRIREARRKFEEKEAKKDRKLRQERMKRRETEELKNEKHREQKTEASEQSKLKKSRRRNDSAQKEQQDDASHERLASRSYDEHRPAHDMSLPRQGYEAGSSRSRACGAKPKDWVCAVFCLVANEALELRWTLDDYIRI
ncbi:hypothetical protein LTR49_018766 [Elasticomyces elasticus]|nr:hypothetical protein LTR49_018766 [Elasticomyces elasticus]KAK5742565.1 hypothetical protein LTS12_024196 [Elasticomyces elasticus]